MLRKFKVFKNIKKHAFVKSLPKIIKVINGAK